MATIQEIYQTLESTTKLGYVLIKGEGIDTEIGKGVAKFLLRIPNSEVSLYQLSSCYEGSVSPAEANLRKWLLDTLVPAGLVYEIKPEVYVVTDAAKNANYTFHTSMRVKKTTSDDLDGYKQKPGGMFPIPDE